MVSALAFLATGVATVFAETMLVRSTRRRRPHEAAWAVSLALFALACAALAVGTSTGWDPGTFRAFYLFGAVLDVPWLSLGTVYLLLGDRAGRRARAVLIFLSGLAVGIVLAAPVLGSTAGRAIPLGREIFGPLPRVMAASFSGVGAIVVLAGAAWSTARYARSGRGSSGARLAAANGLIALGTLVLSGGGLLQGTLGHDLAFSTSLAVGILVIYAGFLVATTRAVSSTPTGTLSSPRRRPEAAPVGR